MRQQIINYLNVVLGESNHPKEVDQVLDLVNDAISVQALLHQTENTLIDLIIKEDLKFKISFSATLDPVVNQNILVQNTQSQELIEDRKKFMKVSKSTSKDLGIF